MLQSLPSVLSVRLKPLLSLVLILAVWLALSTLSLAQGPQVTHTKPATNAVAVPLTSTLSITFSQNIDSATINNNTVTAYGMMGGLLTGTYTTTAKLVEFQPSRALFPGEVVRTTVVSTVQNITGTKAISYQWQFEAGVVKERPPITFTQDVPASANLTRLHYNGVAWGDYDNDGDLDILLSGNSGSTASPIPTMEIWANQNGSFTLTTALTGVYYSSVAWGDYDNDGDLDILSNGTEDESDGRTEIWENQGDGSFNNQSIPLDNMWSGSVAWGDYDNDGDLDILLSGVRGLGNRNTEIWENQGGGTFTELTTANLTGVVTGNAAWGDYDNDGDLDVLISGLSMSSSITEIWENQGGGIFSNISTNLTQTSSSNAFWGDYDNDGDLDILLSGRTVSSTLTTEIWENQGGNSFTLTTNLPGVQYNSVAWADYDNDGDLDVLISGSGEDFRPITEIWENQGGGNFAQAASLTGVDFSSVAWGDYDNDGDLDILLSGQNINGVPITEIWRNNDVFNLTVTTIGNGELNLTSGPYAEGSILTATAVASDGWQFDGWTGDIDSGSANFPLLMDADKAITATFSLQEILTFTLTAQPGLWYANGLDEIPLTMQAFRADGSTAMLAGHSVTLTGATLGTILSPSLTLDNAGQAQTLYRAGVVSGMDVLTATLSDETGPLKTATTSVELLTNSLQGQLRSLFRGEVITYTFVLSNVGGELQAQTVLTGTVPELTRFVGATGGSVWPITGTAQNRYIVSPPVDLAPGEVYTLTWAVQIISRVGDIVGRATAESNTSRLLLNIEDRIFRILLPQVFNNSAIVP